MRTSFNTIFKAIAEHGEVSRAELAELTGFSQVTVGKAVDLMDSFGIITQRKKDSSSVGRKSGICCLSDSHAMLLVGICPDSVRVRAVGLDMETIADFRHEGAPGADAIAIGFADYSGAAEKELIGIAAVVPDGELRLWTERFALAGFLPDMIVESGEAWGAAMADSCSAGGYAVHLHVGEHTEGVITHSGQLYRGSHGAGGRIDCGMIEAAGGIIPAVLLICRLIDPCLIHICCDDAAECESIAGELDGLMPEQTMPELIIEPASASRDLLYGTALLLREKWIRSKLENNS